MPARAQARGVAWIVAILLFFFMTNASAQQADGFANSEFFWGDGVAIGLLVPIDLYLQPRQPPPYPNRRGAHPRFDLSIRESLAWDESARPTAETLSDVGLNTFLLAPFVTPALGNLSFDRSVGRGTMVGAEAFLVNLAVTYTIKNIVRRARPDAVEHPEHEAHLSFFSGHTSVAFSGATMISIYAYEYNWANEANWVIPTTAFTLAAATGYFRIAARRHWFTDVLVGAILGTGTTYAVYRIREQ